MNTDKRLVYMDHAATTATRPEVAEAMLPYMTGHFGNPSSLYDLAKASREALEEARERVAAAIGAEPKQVYFTSGGTESDNWALKGVAFAKKEKGSHIITSVVEHHAISHTCEWLEKQGFSVTYLPVDRFGMVNPADVEAAITPETILITVMMANNEVGTIQPVAEIGAIAKKHGVLFHTDAVQAVGHIPVDVGELNIDLLSLSGHKFHGPKGTGALYIGPGVRLDPLMHGGAQERGRRAGTENVPGIVGLGLAVSLAVADMAENAERLTALRDRLTAGLLAIPHTYLNGHPDKRLPNNVNVVFEFIEGESILLLLNRYGIAASTGSACSSRSLDPSHVLMACGLPHEVVHGSLRLTLGEETTEADVDYVIAAVKEVVQRLRDMSPLTPPELRSQSIGGDKICITRR
ncbi:cysteine desulfurase NifS [Methanogenium sp. MK-MG]|uniref:cysteine desulfurase NifS n=1 Tax=Methanogenium sp. MK-MG TaxID=2599926 RepID=UPI0013EADB21|nr:cysteine desulfurase NifS [Methanogenium sp. MK-MG]KAF1075948.1 Cysteine desulfurase IscS 2 [Methanogenium sp. MK-MG]